jgi:hypothetical protein
VPPQSSTLSHWQALAAQLKPGVQARPQAPQFAASAVTSVQPVASQQSSFTRQPGAVLPLQEQTFAPWASRQRSPGLQPTSPHWHKEFTHSTPEPLPQSFLKSQLH